MRPTQRTFTNVETGERWRLYVDVYTDKFTLIWDNEDQSKFAKGTEVNGFYISAHTGATIKLNTKKEILVNMGQFYHLKEGERVISRKFIGFKRFTKI